MKCLAVVEPRTTTHATEGESVQLIVGTNAGTGIFHAYIAQHARIVVVVRTAEMDVHACGCCGCVDALNGTLGALIDNSLAKNYETAPAAFLSILGCEHDRLIGCTLSHDFAPTGDD